jgi:hypothetical protein
MAVVTLHFEHNYLLPHRKHTVNIQSPSLLANIQNPEVYPAGKIQSFGMSQVVTAVLYMFKARI